MHLLGMLREKATARAEILDAPVHLHARADGIAVRFHASQAQRDGVPSRAAMVLQNAHLRGEAALQNDVEIAIAIDIGNRERTRIIGEIEAAYA